MSLLFYVIAIVLFLVTALTEEHWRLFIALGLAAFAAAHIAWPVGWTRR